MAEHLLFDKEKRSHFNNKNVRLCSLQSTFIYTSSTNNKSLESFQLFVDNDYPTNSDKRSASTDYNKSRIKKIKRSKIQTGDSLMKLCQLEWNQKVYGIGDCTKTKSESIVNATDSKNDVKINNNIVSCDLLTTISPNVKISQIRPDEESHGLLLHQNAEEEKSVLSCRKYLLVHSKHEVSSRSSSSRQSPYANRSLKNERSEIILSNGSSLNRSRANMVRKGFSLGSTSNPSRFDLLQLNSNQNKDCSTMLSSPFFRLVSTKSVVTKKVSEVVNDKIGVNTSPSESRLKAEYIKFDSNKWEQEKRQRLDRMVDQIKVNSVRITSGRNNSPITEVKSPNILAARHWIPTANIKTVISIDMNKQIPSGLLSFSKNSKTAVTNAKNKSYEDVTNGIKFQLKSCLGRGSFGFAILANVESNSQVKELSCPETTTQTVIKVGHESAFILWEVLIHQKLSTMLELKNDCTLSKRYSDRFFPPTALYTFKDSSFIVMEFGDLGTVVDVIHAIQLHPRLNTVEHEWIVMNITSQMVQALSCLHSCHIIHTDIKTDNWVLKSDGNCIRVCMIDFGKAKDLSTDSTSLYRSILNHKESANITQKSDSLRSKFNSPTTINRKAKNSYAVQNIKTSSDSSPNFDLEKGKSNNLVFTGNSGAKGFSCQEMLNDLPWTYQADYYGLCSCLHQMLYLEELTTLKTTIDVATRRGFDESQVMQLLKKKKTPPNDELFFIPKTSIKRYWDQDLWSFIYLTLLNHDNLSEPADFHKLLNSLTKSITVKLTISPNDAWSKLKNRLSNRLNKNVN